MRALLAGALVLGVGATLTLAAWTDTEVAQGTFTASTFGIVGAAGPGTAPAFSDHPSGSPAALAFTLTPNALSPGTTVYSRFIVKTTPTTNVTGTVTLGGATVTGSGLGTYLRYGVRTIPATSNCDATSYAAGTAVVANGSPLTAGAASAQNLAAAGASPVAYCFAVTLPAGTENAAQGLTAAATWTLTATSTS
ncbi:SipW-dependent-type signal peptide-containing protein [Leucobacter ruminantium]|uniref:SipW-dependent-type signal peptide-containing protein n=1 Tax=Leucobacter ruminantium TaxID=1289170 RepID=UPI0031333B92